jgi:SAM-dependent methyltransferase
MRSDVKRLGEIYPQPGEEAGDLLKRLYWPSAYHLAARCAALLSPIDFSRYSPQRRLRLLDVGCGYGLLLDYLKENDLLDLVDYTGVDLVDTVLTEARNRWPGAHFEKRDVQDQPFPENSFDYAICCGLFSMNHGNAYAEAAALAEAILRALWPSVTEGLGFDCMSKHVDWERDDLFHWPLDDTMAFCKRDLSRHVSFKLDYGLWTMTTLVSKTPRATVSRIPPGWAPPPAFDLAELTDAGRSPRLAAQSATGRDRFDYAPGQPNLYMTMLFKHFLVKDYGIEIGFSLYRQVIAPHRQASLKPLALISHHTYCAARASTFREIFPAGEPIAVPPPRVIGHGNHRTLTNTSRSCFVACVDNAVVRGRSAIIEVGDVALADFQGDELTRIDDEMEMDSAVFHRDGDQIWVIAEDRPARRMETAFILLGPRTDFFGDWFGESISKYVAATLRGDLPPVPILIDACMPRTHRQALELMVPGDVEIIEIPAFETVHVERLWSASAIGYHAFHQQQNQRFKWDYFLTSPKTDVAVDGEMVRRVDLHLGDRRGPERVFLARKAFRHRKLENHLEIEAMAAEAGFAIVYPEDLDFVDQAGLLRSARFVIAPEGSAFFLAAFLKPGARACLFNHQETEGLALYSGWCALMGIDLTIITGPLAGPHHVPQHVDYRIDADVFRRLLAEWAPDSNGP